MLSKTKLKYIQSLGQKKSRDEAGLFIAEGPKLVEEFLTTVPSLVTEIFGVKEWTDKNKIPHGGTEVHEITEAELERISELKTPNQVLAVIKKMPVNNSPDLKNKITLALDTIQDPGNMGTIIRIADWFRVENIFCSMDCADIYNPKVVQATMGSLARVNIVYADLGDWLRKQAEIKKYAAVLEGSPLDAIGKIKEGIIIIGNESKGISEAVLANANKKISIERKGKAESLNAAVATGIILSHLKE